VNSPGRIAIVTSGHLSTCPRMLKAADALADAGYAVRVVSAAFEPWAAQTDCDVRARRAWPVDTVDYRRHGNSWLYRWSGVRYQAARRAALLAGPCRVPFGIAARAFGRVHTELVRAVAAQPADFVYGGTAGALAAAAVAAGRLGVPFACDLEDFHTGESGGPEGALTRALADRVESRVLPRARFLTAASGAIADAYRERYGVHPIVLNNTFPLPDRAPDTLPPSGQGLRLYWFSQTIGPDRGLEDAVAAMGRANLQGELSLRGRPLPGYIDGLRRLAADAAPRLSIVTLPPAPPDAMIDLARGYDVGLALEQMTVLNRRLCLTNKAFTYILAGVAVAMTDTPGQHALGADLGCGAALVPPHDIGALAAALAHWANDPAALAGAKRAAWSAAVRRWHWEHDEERGALLNLVGAALPRVS
jgi:glycosyltransferase involved in cell wall biosynthesis